MHSFTMVTRIWIWKCFNLVPFTSRAKSSCVLHTFFFNECTKNLKGKINYWGVNDMLQGMMPKYFCTIHSSKPKSLHSHKKEICKQTWNALVNRSSFKDQLFLPSRGVLLGGRWLNPLTPRSVMKKTWSLVLTFKSVEKNLWRSMRSLTLHFHMVVLFYFVRNSNFWVCGGNLMAWPFKWNLSHSTFTWFY